MHEEILNQTKSWLINMVVGLNLCPFSHRVLKDNSIRYFISHSKDVSHLLEELSDEIAYLDDHPDIETTLIIIADQLHNFMDYLDALGLGEDLIADLDREGIYQIASFHPHYQFANSEPNDVENYTNRSPYPMFHILREDSLEKAIDQYPDVDNIPINNMALLKSLGIDKVLARAHATEILEKD